MEDPQISHFLEEQQAINTIALENSSFKLPLGTIEAQPHLPWR
jgi:hypothetical protein